MWGVADVETTVRELQQIALNENVLNRILF